MQRPTVDTSSAAAAGGPLASPTTCQSQQQQQPCSAFDTLPEHVLTLIAQHLIGGTLENFRRTCSHFRAAANLRTKSLDFHELCGWDLSDSAATQLPPYAVAALADHPNVSKLSIPSVWKHKGVVQLLQHIAASSACGSPSSCSSSAGSCVGDRISSSIETSRSSSEQRRRRSSSEQSSSPSSSSSSMGSFISPDSSFSSSYGTYCYVNPSKASTTATSSSSTRIGQLSSLELHFQSVCPSLCAALAELAPGITRLELSLDLAFELTTKQVGIAGAADEVVG